MNAHEEQNWDWHNLKGPCISHAQIKRNLYSSTRTFVGGLPQVLYELCVQEADEEASEPCKEPVGDRQDLQATQTIAISCP